MSSRWHKIPNPELKQLNKQTNKKNLLLEECHVKGMYLSDQESAKTDTASRIFISTRYDLFVSAIIKGESCQRKGRGLCDMQDVWDLQRLQGKLDCAKHSRKVDKLCINAVSHLERALEPI